MNVRPSVKHYAERGAFRVPKVVYHHAFAIALLWLVEEDMREVRDEIAWLIREEAKRRGLWDKAVFAWENREIGDEGTNDGGSQDGT